MFVFLLGAAEHSLDQQQARRGQEREEGSLCHACLVRKPVLSPGTLPSHTTIADCTELSASVALGWAKGSQLLAVAVALPAPASQGPHTSCALPAGLWYVTRGNLERWRRLFPPCCACWCWKGDSLLESSLRSGAGAPEPRASEERPQRGVWERRNAWPARQNVGSEE